MNVVPENSAYASSTNTIASAGTAPAMVANRVERHRHAGRVVRVGQEDHARVRRDGGEHVVERKAEIGARHDAHRPAADDFGVEPEDLERRLGNDRFRHEAARRRSQIGDRDRHDPFVEPVDQRDRVGGDAEIAGARLDRRGVRRVEADLVGAERRSASSTRGEQPPVFSFWCSRRPSYSSAGFWYVIMTGGPRSMPRAPRVLRRGRAARWSAPAAPDRRASRAAPTSRGRNRPRSGRRGTAPRPAVGSTWFEPVA